MDTLKFLKAMADEGTCVEMETGEKEEEGRERRAGGESTCTWARG